MEEKDENNNNNNIGPTDEGLNLSSPNNTGKVPELKQMEIFAVEKEAEVEELKLELTDSDVKQDEVMMEEKEIETLSSEFSDICTKESTGVNNNNNTAMKQEEEIEPFSGVLSDSDVNRVREMIESDPFLYQVVDSFLKYQDELRSGEQNGYDCAKGGSTVSVVNDTEMDEEKVM